MREETAISTSFSTFSLIMILNFSLFESICSNTLEDKNTNKLWTLSIFGPGYGGSVAFVWGRPIYKLASSFKLRNK